MFVESSPHPVLLAGIEEVLAHGWCCRRWWFRRWVVMRAGLGRFWLSVGQLFTAGVGVDWPAVFAGGGARVGLPTYALSAAAVLVAPGRVRLMLAVWVLAGAACGVGGGGGTA